MKNLKKLLALLLTVSMLTGLLGTAVFAAGPETSDPPMEGENLTDLGAGDTVPAPEDEDGRAIAPQADDGTVHNIAELRAAVEACPRFATTTITLGESFRAVGDDTAAFVAIITINDADGKGIILDLNGCQITATTTLFSVGPRCSLTICDSSENQTGSIQCTSSRKPLVEMVGGSFTLESGKLEQLGSGAAVYAQDAGGFNKSEVTISGGSLVAENGKALDTNDADCAISGGEITGAVAGNPTITGGTFVGDAATESVKEILSDKGYTLDENGELIIDEENNDFTATVGNLGYDSLQDAIAAAESGDTVTLLKDVPVSEMVKVEKDITLDLNTFTINGGCTFSANDTEVAEENRGIGSTVLAVFNSTVTIKNGTVTGGYGNNKAGGIYALNSELTLTDVHVDKNFATAYGGGMFVEGTGSLTITGGSINDNKVGGTTNENGGGIYIKGWDKNSPIETVMTGVVISGNKAPAYAGGIRTWRTDMTLNNVTVEENESWFGGGIVLGSDTDFVMNGGKITNNRALGCSGEQYGSGAGAGMYIDRVRNKATLNGVTITGNIASTEYQGNGGGIFVSAPSNSEGNYTTLILGADNVIANNTDHNNNETSNIYTCPGATTGEAVAAIGSKGYTTLADAIAAAEDSDTVTLLVSEIDLGEDNGIVLNKKLTIQGRTEGTVIKGTGTADYANGLITLTGGSEGSVLKNLTLEFTATGAQRAAVYFDYGFTGGSAENVTKLTNVTIDGKSSNAFGISSTYITGGHVEISGCTLQNLKYGMYFNAIHDLTVTDNTITNTVYNAINLAGDNESYPSSNIAITGNTLTGISSGNYEYDEYSSGIRVGLGVSNVTLAGNSITMLNDKKDVYYDGAVEVNGVYYATLAEAVAAAQSGDTVTLLKDTEETAVIEVKRSVTIEGKDHKVNSSANRILWVDAGDVTVTLNDIEFVSAVAERGVQVNPNLTNVTLNINHCVVPGTYYAVNMCSNTSVTLNIDRSTVSGWGALNLWGNTYDVRVTNSTLIGTNDKGYSAEGWNGFGVIVLEGDTTGKTEEHVEGCHVVLENCVIQANTVKNADGNANIQKAILFNIKSKDNLVEIKGDTVVSYDQGELTPFCIDNGGNNQLVLYGGTYSDNVDEYCAEGFAPVKNAEGKYVVLKQDAAVAAVGGERYLTLTDAINAAQPGDTVTLLQDVTLDTAMGDQKYTSAILITKDLTLEGGNNTITVAGQFHGIQASGSVDVTIKDLTVTGAGKDALLVNRGSNVTVENLTTSGNAWGAINVDHGSTLNFLGGSLSENTKIWTEDFEHCHITATGLVEVHNLPSEAGKVHYLEADDTRLIAKIDNTYYGSLTDAINAARPGDTVTLLQPVTLNTAMGDQKYTSAILITKDLTLEGGGNTITVKGNFHGIQVSGNVAVTIKDLTVTGAGKDALLVNRGANVTAEKLTTSGNAWGGVNVDHGSHFTLTGTVNISDSPMIWSEDYGTDGGSTVITDLVSVRGMPDGMTHFMTEAQAKEATVAMIGQVRYATLAAAVAAAQSGDTVTLVKDVENGSGVALMASDAKTLTIDLGGFTYNASEPYVGSTGTKTQGFHFEAGNTVTLKNGTITTTAPMAIQNYCDLTLEDLTVTGGDSTSYIVSCNAGNITLNNVNLSGSKSDVVALDVMHWHGRYATAPSMTINNSAENTILGKIDVYCYDNGVVDDCDAHAALTITGGTYSSDVSAYLANGYLALLENNQYTVTQTTLTISAGTLQLYTGETGALTVTPATAAGLTWTSSNPAVATVNNGAVTAVAAGTTTITAEISTGATVTCTVTVQNRPTPVIPGGGGGGGSTEIEDPDVPLAGVLPFEDVEESDWFYNGVYNVYFKDLMVGVSDTLFDPQGAITRGMIVSILYRLEGSPAVSGDAGFDDVPAGQWYTDGVTWAASHKIVEGYGDGTFQPNKSITREEFAAILYRYASYKGYDTAVEESATLNFTDAEDVSQYAVKALLWAVKHEMLNGMGDGTLAARGGATRAQAALIFTDFCAKFTDEAEEK